MDTDFLRSVAFLRDLTDDELKAFADLLEPLTAEHGDTLLEEGGDVSSLYIICDGAVHVRRKAQSRDVLLGRMGKGAFFGEMNLFDYGIATATITAAMKTELAVVSYEALRQLMGDNPVIGYKLAAALMREVSRRLRLSNERFVQSVFWQTEKMED